MEKVLPPVGYFSPLKGIPCESAFIHLPRKEGSV